MSFLLSGGAASDIPDSVVFRPDDTSSGSVTDKIGCRITTDIEWPDIGGKISSNVSGATTAYIYQVNDGSLLGSEDISSLSAGDSFAVSGVDLKPYDGTNATVYNFVLDAGGSSFTNGYYNSASFPYISNDGNLSIINGARRETDTSSAPNNLVEIGNPDGILG